MGPLTTVLQTASVLAVTAAISPSITPTSALQGGRGPDHLRELLPDPCLGIDGHHSHALPPSSIPESTLPPYVDLLGTRYLLQRIPAWSNHLAGRVVKAPKVALLYRGLTARLLNVSALSLANDVNPDSAGHLIEIFILSKLPMQLPHTRAKLSTSGCERGIKCGVDGLPIVTDSLRLPVAAVVVQVFGGGRIVSDGLVFRALTA